MSAQAPVAHAPSDAPKKSRKKLLVMLAAVLVLAGGGGGGWWWWSSHAAPSKNAAEKKLPTQYYAMDPAFVVNLADAESTRYLQADVQISTRDPETLKALQEQGPAIRNRLLLLFGQQSGATLIQRSGKERLQEKALAEVRSVLQQEGAAGKVDKVIFTSLVIQ